MIPSPYHPPCGGLPAQTALMTGRAVFTEAGLEAIGIEPLVASAVASARKAKAKAEPAPYDTDTAKPVAIRAGTKQAQIIAMLQRPEGATIAEMVQATGWLAHTVRGSISGAIKKKLGLPVNAEKVEGRGTVYSLCVKVDLYLG